MFTEALWDRWVEVESRNYDIHTRKFKKKGYLHFDRRIWFPEKLSFYKDFFQHPEKIAQHSFYPFLKVVIKTPRYKWDKKKESYSIKYKKRPIGYAAHGDALIYSYYASVLTSCYEDYLKQNGLSDNVLAYRALEDGKCNIDFAKEVFHYIKAKGECTAIAMDIKGFFDNLDHKILKNNWRTVIKKELPEDQYKIFKSVTQFSFVKKNTLLKHLGIELSKLKTPLPRICEPAQFRVVRADKNIISTNSSGVGIPQGSPISAVLSNIYMIEFDKAIAALANLHSFLYRRYCDDVIIVCDTSRLDDVKDMIDAEIKKVNLNVQPDKEEVIVFSKNEKGNLRGYNRKAPEPMPYKNLQYLGFEFSGINVYLRSSSLSRYFRRMKSKAKETVKTAYSKDNGGKQIFKQKLYHRYSHLGENNFISYALRAARIFNSPTIRKQIARHVEKLKNALERNKALHEERAKELLQLKNEGIQNETALPPKY